MTLVERRPRSSAWTRAPDIERLELETESHSVWTRFTLNVISSLTIAELPDRSGTGPQWHVSVAVKGGARRPTDEEMVRVRRAFDMERAEEDNHEPGRARHLWLAVNPANRVDCECKEDEVTIVEPDGHRWQAPPDKIEQRRAEMLLAWGRR